MNAHDDDDDDDVPYAARELFAFGLGMGHLSAEVEAAVTICGAALVNHIDPQTGAKRHWFTGPNRSPGINREFIRFVEDRVREAATDSDRRLLGDDDA